MSFFKKTSNKQAETIINSSSQVNNFINISKKSRRFDLNIEKILSNWEPFHAVREIIANSLDEHKILNIKKPIEIYKSWGNWYIKDYGRGLKEEHLTQKENKEKNNHKNLIGQFGIGLKDAFATLDKGNIKVEVISKYINIKAIESSKKAGFNDIKTLHAIIEDSIDSDFEGTLFILKGLKDSDVIKAKQLFLVFTKLPVLEKTPYGEILEPDLVPSIYLNGIKIAEEKGFLFSYNITSLDYKIKKALNRERTNVGRNAYSDRIRSILTNSQDEDVISKLRVEFTKITNNDSCDEMRWIDVQEHIVKFLNDDDDSVFVTSSELQEHSRFIDEITTADANKKVIVIPENLKNKFNNMEDNNGNSIHDLDNYVSLREENFQYDFIDINELTTEELEIYNKIDQIAKLINFDLSSINGIFIAKKLQLDVTNFKEAVGFFDPATNKIYISRSQLESLENFAGTLLHEMIHAESGYVDVTSHFESALTIALGKLTTIII